MLTAIAVIATGTRLLVELGGMPSGACTLEKRTCVKQDRRQTCRSYQQRQCRMQSVADFPTIDEYVPVDRVPYALNIESVRQQMDYPDYLQQAGIRGIVVARVLVDAEGNYRQHRVISQSHPALSRNCEQHIAELRFSPASFHDTPVAYWVNVPFHFGM
ncbi:MAG: hypothetical protein OHK0039_48330 [Bacteroidia bacterium]